MKDKFLAIYKLIQKFENPTFNDLIDSNEVEDIPFDEFIMILSYLLKNKYIIWLRNERVFIINTESP